MKRMARMFYRRSLLDWDAAEIAAIGQQAERVLRLLLKAKQLRLVGRGDQS